MFRTWMMLGAVACLPLPLAAAPADALPSLSGGLPRLQIASAGLGLNSGAINSKLQNDEERADAGRAAARGGFHHETRRKPPGIRNQASLLSQREGEGLDPSLQVATARPAGQDDWVAQARQGSRRELPVWELGVGVSAISLPDYRGAESRRRYVVPFPVFVYRARHLHVDRNGIRADLWDNRRLELDLSVGMSAPVRSDPDGIRAGMPRLRPLLELGPRLIAHLWSGDAGRQRLQLQLPLRLAMPLGKLQQTGWVLSPTLHMQVDHVAGFRGWTLSGWAGPVFATRAYHQYYYRVSAGHARAGRPAYEASGGYGGMQYSLTLNKRYPDYWLAAFMRLDQVSGAVFEESPLVRRRSGLTAGLVFGWLFRRSAETVPQTQ